MARSTWIGRLPIVSIGEMNSSRFTNGTPARITFCHPKIEGLRRSPPRLTGEQIASTTKSRRANQVPSGISILEMIASFDQSSEGRP